MRIRISPKSKLNVMKKCKSSAVLSLLTGFLALSSQMSQGQQVTVDSSQLGKQKAEHLEKEVTVKHELDYLLYLPADLQCKEKWPLLVFLHGAGERGSDINKVKVHGPPKLVESDPNFKFIVLSPQCPTGSWWDPETLKVLIDEIEAKYPVDSNRIYLTGLSMGGFGTWALAAHQPNRFAAIAPICGGGDAVRHTYVIKDIPTWVFHGAKDNVVPLERSQSMVDGMKRFGAKEVKFTIYPEAGHDSWTESYNNPELYDWFLSHKKN